jgi:hypothetical protein
VSALGESELIKTSKRVFSSPAKRGASIETWRPETLKVSAILSSGKSKTSDNSSAEGVLSYSCSSLEKALFILFKEPTWFRGKRTIRACSANAWRIDWRIHHTAYEINLKPRVSSKRRAALIRPKFPSLIKSGKLKPWFWYCLATDTTKRKLARVNLSRALWSPSRILRANTTSSSAVISSSLPISCRYLS